MGCASAGSHVEPVRMGVNDAQVTRAVPAARKFRQFDAVSQMLSKVVTDR